MDLGVSAAETVEHVQSLINDGYVEKPLILVITEDGARWQTVDYYTYKEYMTSNAIVLRSYYGIQPNILDSLFMDSIRSNLLKALKADTLNAEYQFRWHP
jgi:predicted transcriptional regulator